MDSTYVFANDNGTFVCFLDYEEEDDFDSFLSFVFAKLDVKQSSMVESPYSLLVEFAFRGTQLLATYSSDAGCHLRIPPGSELSAKEIVEQCYN